MEAIAFIARFVLAGVFAVAGVAKLFDRPGSREALKGFGVPDALVAPGSIALPLAELAVAAALLIPATVTAGAIGAVVLLGLFVIGIGVNMALGRTPDCHCFGQLHSAPAGWSTLLRNAVLGGLGGLVVWKGQSASFSDISSLEVFGNGANDGWLLTLAAIAVIQTIFIFGLLRQNGRILLRLDALEDGSAADTSANKGSKSGLPVGSTAPEFSLPGLHGETMTLGALRSEGKPIVMLFTDPKCGPCNSLMPDVSAWQRDREDHKIVLVSRGSVEDNAAKAEEHGLANILIQKDFEVAEAYRFKGTPSAVVVDAQGRMASELVAGPHPIRELVNRRLGVPSTAGSPATHGPQAFPLGNPAPNFELNDLSGESIQLAEFKGRDTVVLFWSPTCGFCRKMLDDLKRWESTRGPDSPELLVVSTGDIEEVRAQGFSSQVLMDNGAIAPLFGATGTPVAVLIDKDGKVASPLAIGASAVLELAGAKSLSA